LRHGFSEKYLGLFLKKCK